MALPDIDSSVGHSFGLEVDGVQISRISEVTGLKMEQDVVELKEEGPDGKAVIRRLPGRWKSPDVTMTRGLTSDASFRNWVKLAQDAEANGARKSGAISIFDQQGTLLAKYVFTNAWPRSLEVASLESGDTSVLIERLVLVLEPLEPG